MWQQYETEEKKDAFIDPNCVRAVLPSKHGDTFSLLVLDGGVKVHVGQGGPAFMYRSLLASTVLLANGGPTNSAPDPTSSTLDYVNSFASIMEDRLARNRHKGDRPGWLAETFMTHIEHAEKHLAALKTAFLHGAKQEELDRTAADCANRIMMARDRYSSAIR